MTRRTAIDLIRQETRRQHREQISAELHPPGPPESEWNAIEPLLDEALETLGEGDRCAILLRFFENKSLREVGRTLGTSEDAAQKRISRAIDKLRQFLLKRGAATSAAGLAALLPVHAVQAAPAGLVASLITASTGLAGAAHLTTSGAIAIAMTTTQKICVSAILAAALGTGIYEAHVASRLKREHQDLLRRQAPLAGEVVRLRQDRDQLAARLETAQNQINRLAHSPPPTAPAPTPEVKATSTNRPADLLKEPISTELATRMALLNHRLQQNPAAYIPELQFIQDRDWLEAAKRMKDESEIEMRKGLSLLRSLGKKHFAPKAMQALIHYAEANQGRLPATILDLKPYFEEPVDDFLLQRYEVIAQGNMDDIGYNPVIREKESSDATYDSISLIGMRGAGSGGGPMTLFPEPGPNEIITKAAQTVSITTNTP